PESTTLGTDPATSMATTRPSSSDSGATVEAASSSPAATTLRTREPSGSSTSAARYLLPRSARLTSATVRSVGAGTSPGTSGGALAQTRVVEFAVVMSR